MDDMELEAWEGEPKPLPPKKEAVDMKKEVFGWVESIIVSVVVVALLYAFIGRTVMVDGSSMVPTLHNEDRIVTTLLHGELKQGDVVVISRKNDITLVKRVVAVGGQTVDIDYENNRVLVDGEPLREPYIQEAMRETSYTSIQLPLTVPEGFLFVMGDNRNHSGDSRDPDIGLIDERNVFGKAVWRIYPFDQIGTIQ